MKERKTRRISFVLAAVGAVAGFGLAAFYRLQLEEYNQSSLPVPPELLHQVREEGLTLVCWIDDSGKQCFKTIDESGS